VNNIATLVPLTAQVISTGVPRENVMDALIQRGLTPQGAILIYEAASIFLTGTHQG